MSNISELIDFLDNKNNICIKKLKEKLEIEDDDDEKNKIQNKIDQIELINQSRKQIYEKFINEM